MRVEVEHDGELLSVDSRAPLTILEVLERLELEDLATGSGARSLGEVTGLVSFVAVRVGDELRAVLGLGPRLSGQTLAEEDREFIATLGAQALVAVDNLHLHV
ncbi:MAG: hypothetical protein DSY41_03475, partial [Candidatus Poseidoniales archaeon]